MTAPQAGLQSSPAPTTTSKIAERPLLFWTAPLLLALVLFLSNNATNLGAHWYSPPPGHVPYGTVRGTDNAQYVTWLEALRTKWVLPNYSAPWITEPALRVPIWWVPASLVRLGLSPIAAYKTVEFAWYVLAAYGLAFLLVTFLDRWREIAAATAVILCCVPAQAYLLAPVLLIRPSAWTWRSGFDSFRGGGSSDGFFVGLGASGTQTFGTAAALWGLVACWWALRTRSRKAEWAAGAVLAAGALLHPYEFLPVSFATGLVIALSRRSWWPDKIRAGVIIAGPTAIAVFLMYVMPILGSRWMNIFADTTKYTEPISAYGLVALGWPVLFAGALALRRPWAGDARVSLLKFYVLFVLAAQFSLHLPWPQHFIDGMHYAAAVLIVLELTPWVRKLNTGWRRTAFAASFAVAALGAIFAHVWFRSYAFQEGGKRTETSNLSALAPIDQLAIIDTLRRIGTEHDLVFSPREHAPWFMTRPMHSFAGHWQCGLTSQQQKRIADDFFAGRFSRAEAAALLESYGVRWLVVPSNSPAIAYAEGLPRRAVHGNLSLYERPGAVMKPLPELTRVSKGIWEWVSERALGH